MIAVFAAIAASVAMADEWSEYIWQSKNDTAGGATSAFNTGSYWTGGDPPRSNRKYYVKPGWMFATPNTDSGDVLRWRHGWDHKVKSNVHDLWYGRDIQGDLYAGHLFRLSDINDKRTHVCDSHCMV